MMNEIIFILLVFALPAAIGFKMAVSRGKNPLLWGFLSAVFPFFIIVLYFDKPKHEIKGHFRKCTGCAEIIRWKDSNCKYCGLTVLDSKII